MAFELETQASNKFKQMFAADNAYAQQPAAAHSNIAKHSRPAANTPFCSWCLPFQQQKECNMCTKRIKARRQRQQGIGSLLHSCPVLCTELGL
jgi:recombinational DNA repair protein RecR